MYAVVVVLVSLVVGLVGTIMVSFVTDNKMALRFAFGIWTISFLTIGFVGRPMPEEKQEIAQRRTEIKETAQLIRDQAQNGDFLRLEGGKLRLVTRVVNNQKVHVSGLGVSEVVFNLSYEPDSAEGVILIPRIVDGVVNPEWEAALDEFFKQ